MKRFLITGIACAGCAMSSMAQKDSTTTSKKEDSTAISQQPATEPFAFGDFTWLNGNNRKKVSPLFDSKYFTGDVTIDVNTTHSFNNPIDNTVVGSTALARNNEMQISYIGLGGDFHWNNVRGRFMTQIGTRSTVVPRNDGSSYKGQYSLQDVYRYVSEAYAGYHWNKWHGINLDAGIFMSYIGLFSYNNFENWGYQPSYTSDNTPWFFNGLRLQTFPTDKLKVEFWLINGWQSYGTFNKMPGFGFSVYYRPKETVDYVSNFYVGKDAAGIPNRTRIHSDNSYQLRYYNRPGGNFITKAAFSLTGDFGIENGGGVSPFGGKNGPAQNFISGMAYNRVWFGKKQKFAFTAGGGVMHNPGWYLVLAPTGYADTTFQQKNVPGTKFDAWDCSASLDFMPNDFLTFKIEYVHRQLIDMKDANGNSMGYFAGSGGVTGPGGYVPASTYTVNGTAIPAPLSSLGGWMPDLVNKESRITFALLVRF